MHFADKPVIAISSRVLFDLRGSHEINEKQGGAACSQYQIEHQDEMLASAARQNTTIHSPGIQERPSMGTVLCREERGGGAMGNE